LLYLEGLLKKLRIIFYSLLLIPSLTFFYCSEEFIELPKNDYSWPESTPSEQGLNPTQLERGFTDAAEKGYVHSILIVRNGYIVSEKYFSGYDKSRPNNIKSVSKSFLSAMIGIAVREGYIENLDQKMMDFFPEHSENVADPKKFDITIKDLLQMRAGFERDENSYTKFVNSSNWIETIINSPLINHPGNQFAYTTGGTHLLCAILSKATGKTALDFGNEYLFNPLQISIKDWEQDPQGYYFGGNNMLFTSRDMARFGLLYLENGTLNNIEIVPSHWINESWNDHLNSSSTWGSLSDIGYGYLWWMGKINNYSVKLAIGHGGQYIVIVPQLNLIIVSTSNSYLDWDEADKQERGILEIVSKYILPAVID
jgi:CubicO group peptidase (beta-lactamase class C family)